MSTDSIHIRAEQYARVLGDAGNIGNAIRNLGEALLRSDSAELRNTRP